MATISKKTSGLLYSETFSSLSAVWSVYPNGSNSISENLNSISVNGGANRVEILIPSPEINDYIFQSEISYTPSSNGVAGIVFKSDTKNYVEISSDSEDTVFARYFKVSYRDDFTVDASYSIDGFEFFNAGNSRIGNVNNIGFFLNDYSSNLEIKKLLIYKSNYIKIDNVNDDLNVKVKINNIDVTSSVLHNRVGNVIILNLSNFIFPLDICVELYKTGYSFVQNLLDVVGGDIYDMSLNVSFAINDINVEDDFVIGNINNEQTFKLTLSNTDSSDIVNSTLKIEATSKYNNGYRSVFIAKYGSDEYGKAISEVNVKSGEFEDFKLRIDRDQDMMTFDEYYKFKITLE